MHGVLARARSGRGAALLVLSSVLAAVTSLAGAAGSTAAPEPAGVTSSDFGTGRRCTMRGASSSSTLESSAIKFSPAKTGLPARHSKSTQPSAKTSERASISFAPRACSGAM